MRTKLFFLMVTRLILPMSLLSASLCFSQDQAVPISPEGIIHSDKLPVYIENHLVKVNDPDVWHKIGPIGIVANSIAVDSQNSNIIYAGGINGLYKTINNGSSWQFSEPSLNNNIRAISIHPNEANVVLAWFDSNIDPSFNLMRSIDGGMNWSIVLETTNGTNGHILFDPVDSQKMFASTNRDSIYLSNDSGLTWSSISPFSRVTAFTMYLQDPSILYATTSADSVFKSSDGGQNWTNQNTSFPGRFSTLVVSATDSSMLFAGDVSFTSNGAGGFYRSEDSGTTWTLSMQGFGLSQSVSMIKLDPFNANGVYAGGRATGLYYSEDLGNQWTLSSGDINDNYVEDLTFSPSGNIYCSFGGGLYSSTDQGNNWQAINGDLQGADVFNIVPDPFDANVIYAGTLGGVYRTGDGGASWQQINDGIIDTDVFALAIDPVNTNTLYAGTFGSLIYKTTDSGNPWLEMSNGLPGLGNGSISDRVTVHPNNPSWIWTGRRNSFQSIDGGENWSPFLINNQRVDEAIIDPFRPDTLYATTNDTLFQSVDGSDSWQVRSSNVRINDLALDPNNPNIMYADSLGNIIRSMDAGLTWAQVDSSVGAIRDIYVNPNSSIVYASTFGNGIRRSTDLGQSWSSYNNGLRDQLTFMVRASIVEPQKIFVATFGGSIYQTEESTTSVDDKSFIVSDFVLEQNYPNPFNPTTTIAFTLPKQIDVSIKLFDLQGRLVTVLVDEKMSAGKYHVVFDAKNIPSGVYFYRIDTEDFVQTKKLTLLK